MMAVPEDDRDSQPAPARAGTGVGAASPDKAAETGTVEEYIGARLRQAFDAVAQQPVPDRFLQLIATLDKA